MSEEELARVVRVPIRSVWPHEQTGFSKWLVDNIDFLNEHLPFDIDPDSLQAEAPAGIFSVDVVGDAASPDSGESFKVVIENQLEETDHRHLGQIMTYAAAYQAKAAVWISASARPEHAKVVQWLNDESSIDAWLFDIEVIRIEDSRPAPVLTRIVGPSDLSRKAKADRQAGHADEQQRLAFWSLALPKVAQACAGQGLWQGRGPNRSVHVWQAAPKGPGRIGWQIWVTGHGSWICLRVDGKTPEEVTHLFTQLEAHRGEIEKEFGGPLTWDPLEGSRASVVRWDNPHPTGFRDSDDTWELATDELADAMGRLISATRHRLTQLAPYKPVASAEVAGAAALTGDTD